MCQRKVENVPYSADLCHAEYGIGGQLAQASARRLDLITRSAFGAVRTEAYLTALGLARNCDIFQAGVDMHGSRRERHRHRVCVLPRRLCVYMALPPVRLIHGDDDRNVTFGQRGDLVGRLRAQQFEELVLPDEIHEFLLWRNWIASYRATVDSNRGDHDAASYPRS